MTGYPIRSPNSMASVGRASHPNVAVDVDVEVDVEIKIGSGVNTELLVFCGKDVKTGGAVLVADGVPVDENPVVVDNWDESSSALAL